MGKLFGRNNTSDAAETPAKSRKKYLRNLRRLSGQAGLVLKEKTLGSDAFRDLRSILNEALILSRQKWKTVVPFLFLYSIINIGITWISTSVFLSLMLKLYGTTYISPDNVVSFFTSPSTIILMLAAFLFLALLQIVEIAGIMHVYSMASVGKETTLRGMISTGVFQGVRSFAPKNWPAVLFILVLIPLTGFFPLSFSTFQAAIPGFIKEFLLANRLYRTLYGIVYFVLLLLEIAWIFSMNFYLLSDTDFLSSMKKSFRLIRGRYFFTILCLLTASLLFTLSVTAVSAALSSILVKLPAIFNSNGAVVTADRLSSVILLIGGLLTSLLTPAFNIAVLTALFFRYIDDRKMLQDLSWKAFNDHHLSRRQGILLAAVGALFIGSYVFLSDSPDLEKPAVLNRPEIVAHRGDSVNAPENTRPAFELALLEQADWVELDVFRTKDGVIVISHDDDLSRTAGKKLFIHDLTFEEFMQLDVGKRFSDKFEGLRPSTLDEILKLYKDKMKVQIEIKYNEYMEGIEEGVLKVINDNGMHDQVIITSLSDIPLRRLKELDPTIITTYSMYIAWSHIEDIPFADYYTVEENNVDEEMVDYVHAKGGKLFAWTVNSEDNVQFLVDCGVDGILTDNPNMLRKALDDASYSTGLPQTLRLYWSLLQEY